MRVGRERVIWDVGGGGVWSFSRGLWEDHHTPLSLGWWVGFVLGWGVGGGLELGGGVGGGVGGGGGGVELGVGSVEGLLTLDLSAVYSLCGALISGASVSVQNFLRCLSSSLTAAEEILASKKQLSFRGRR